MYLYNANQDLKSSKRSLLSLFQCPYFNADIVSTGLKSNYHKI